MLAFDIRRLNSRGARRFTLLRPNAVPLPKTAESSLLPRAVVAALLVAVALAAYHGIEANGFHFDDWHNILLNPALQLDALTLAGLLDAARGASLPHRPFASITFAIDWWRGGGDRAAHFLVTNLVLHGATGIAVFAFLLQTLSKPGTDKARLGTIAAAGLAAAWWLAHPIQVQAVSYVVQRMTELAALFSVLSVWAYVKGRTAPRGRLAWLALSLLCLLLGALSKPNAWIAPVLVLMAEFLVLRQHADLVRNRPDKGLLTLPFILGLLGLAALLGDGPFSQWILRGYEWRDFTLAERLLTQPKVVLFHFSQLIWPLPDRFSLEHDIEIVRSVTSPQFWLPMSAIVAWTLCGIWLALQRNARLAGFFVLWVPVTLLIESSFVPLELVFEHRMYLPSVGVAGLIALGLARMQDAPLKLLLPAWGAVAFATAFGIWSTQQRLPQWQTEISLLENSARHAPRSVRIWNELGLKYLEAGKLELARQAIDRANQIEPRWGDGYPFVNRGVLLEAMGLRDQALAIYEETIRLFPRQVLGYNNRGLIRLRAGQFELASRDFDHAIETDPEYAPAWTNRGTANFLSGRADKALPDFETATRLSPRESIAWHYLAEIYAAQGRQTEASAARLRACRLGVRKDCSQ